MDEILGPDFLQEYQTGPVETQKLRQRSSILTNPFPIHFQKKLVDRVIFRKQVSLHADEFRTEEGRFLHEAVFVSVFTVTRKMPPRIRQCLTR